MWGGGRWGAACGSQLAWVPWPLLIFIIIILINQVVCIRVSDS